MKASFALGTKLVEVHDVSVAGDWSVVQAVILASDFEGVYSPLDIQLGDVHFLGTSASITGTVSLYDVTNIIYATPGSAQLELTFSASNDHPAPDLTFVLGEQGFLTRKSLNLGLSGIPSFTVQNIPERLIPFVINFDTYRILDTNTGGGGGGSNAITAITSATHTRVSVQYTALTNKLAFTADPTNLSFAQTSTSIQLNSSTGSSTTLPSATLAFAGLMSSTDKVKLDAIPTPSSIAVLSSTQVASVNAGASTLPVSYQNSLLANSQVDLILQDYGHTPGSGWLLTVAPVNGNTIEVYYSINGTVFTLFDTLSSEYAMYEGTPGDGITTIRLKHVSGSDACGFNLR